jgi:hypothetical protein
MKENLKMKREAAKTNRMEDHTEETKETGYGISSESMSTASQSNSGADIG